MAKKPRQNPPQTPSSFVQLPLMGNIAMYTRVATKDTLPQNEPSQVFNLTLFAQTLGYSREQLTVFYDEGQAAAPLFESEGYVKLVTAIRAGKVDVLFIADVDQLFVKLIEPQLNDFILMCMEKGTCIVTPETVYDFSTLRLVHQFRVACMKAFERLHEA